MTQAVPTFAQEAYAVLQGRFGSDSFPSDYLSWFVSRGMVKKTLHVLEKSGWIKRVEKGKYVCVNAAEIFRSMVEFKVPGLLAEGGKKYAYADASAVEIWTDFTYMQRSWEHSPYYLKVLRSELKEWVDYFRRHKVKVFVENAEPSLGEFVILKPQDKLARKEHNGFPVEPLQAAVRYCEKHIDSFEYPLAYLRAKFHVSTRAAVDKRVSEEAAKVV